MSKKQRTITLSREERAAKVADLLAQGRPVTVAEVARAGGYEREARAADLLERLSRCIPIYEPRPGYWARIPNGGGEIPRTAPAAWRPWVHRTLSVLAEA